MPTAAERTIAALSRLRRLYAGENQQVIYAEQIASAEKYHNERLAMGLEIRAYGAWDIKDTIEKAFESDESDLADAYRAEHPADDSDLITADWLRTVIEYQEPFFYPRPGEMFVIHQPLGSEVYHVSAGGVFLGTLKTRGDVRNLCRALGIALEGKA